MKRLLVRSTAFARAAKRLSKKQPEVVNDLRDALQLLADDAYDARLKTHKLKGDLAECWSCSVGRDLRIVFKFTNYDGQEVILLQTVGTHDEAY